MKWMSLLLAAGIVVTACGGDDDPEGTPDGGHGDGDADADGDGDADADADGDTDGDGDGDGDADGDADGDFPLACDPPIGGTGDLDCTLEHGGLVRELHLHVPALYADRPESGAPLVFNFHGLLSNGLEQAEWSRMIPKSDAAGFVVVHPEGTGEARGWNSGNEQTANDVDDVGFALAMVAEISAAYAIDPHRVYTTGFSNGGFLSQRLACEQADVFAAAVSVSGLLALDTCTPSRPFPIQHFHGTDDFIVSYDGGGLAGNQSVDDTMAGWATRNGCGQTRTVFFQNGEATCERYDACPAGAEVEVCTIDGGGHAWPGGENLPPLYGHMTNDISATDALWDFFVAHPLP